MKDEVNDLIEHIPGTGDFISVDQSRCSGCGRCIIICIMNLWRIRGGVASLVEGYEKKCLECGACYQSCETDAISFHYPAGGTGIIYKNG
jgi:ferredoxin like protein